jgi:3-hydroxy-9,10-secoandrosta-1,3,5(10)-triene-9,17-dione monooxygenase
MSGSTPRPNRLNDEDEREELVSTARALVPLLRANASKTERDGDVAPRVDAALRAAGLYTLTAPRKFGGREAGVRTIIDVFAELGRGCGSTSWVGKLHCGSAFIASLFGDEARQEVWGEDDKAVVSGSAKASQSTTAHATTDGLMISGEWHYASGIRRAQWVVCNVAKTDTGGSLDALLALVPTSQIVIEDTWNTAGMRGTGSDSFAVSNLFVPLHRTIDLSRTMDRRAQSRPDIEVVYRAPLEPMFGVSLTGPIIGIAQGALERVLATLEEGKTLFGSVYTDARDSPSVRSTLADAASRIDTARLHAYRAAADIEDATINGRQLDVLSNARIRMDTGVAILRCREAVERLLDLGGASVFNCSDPLQRLWRDLAIASRHAAVSPLLIGEAYGRALLGIEGQILTYERSVLHSRDRLGDRER